MTPTYLIRKSVQQDVLNLASRMCKKDTLEVEAFFGTHVRHVLQDSFDKSVISMTFEVDGQVMSMWGIAPCPITNNPRHGLIWLLNSESANEQHSQTYGRVSKRWVRSILPSYDRLYNYADIANQTSVQWLQWLGFEMKEHHYIGGRTYWLFENKKTV